MSRDLETRLVAALADTARRNLPEATPVPAFRPGSSPSRVRAWMVPVLAAAVVIALTVGALALARHWRDSATPPAGTGSGTVVILKARTAGLSAPELDQARRIITARAAALGVRNADVRISGQDEITVVLPGVSDIRAGELGAVGALQLRPLITAPVPAGTTPTARPSNQPAREIDQWRSLGFAPPANAAAYAALSPAHQQAVQAVLTSWDCANQPVNSAGTPMVTCDQDGTKYLLGAAIVASNDVRSAVASAPSVAGQLWQVIVDLTTSGQQRWTSYTTQHNDSDRPGELANQVATVVDGVVIVASTIQSTIVGSTSINGSFDQQAAASLAANLSAGILPAPFDIVSIQKR